MKIRSSWCAGFFAVLSTVTAFAAEPVPPQPVAPSAGLQTYLTTGGYKFILSDDPARPGPASFPASASLYNRSNSDIPFTFPDSGGGARKFTFRVFDSDGTLVWQSDGDIGSLPVITEAILGKGTQWRRNVAVPLKLAGAALTPGVYHLEASIDADKKIGATSIFEVARPPDPTRPSGINGLVLKATGHPPPAANILPAEVPAAGAYIQVVELRTNNARYDRPPFVWNGRTNADGRFTVNAPPARYRVTATLLPGPVTAGTASAPVGVVSKSVEVTVEPERFADVTIHLPAAPPPPAISGIKGLVLYGPISPVAIPGQPNEAPAVRAPVVIEEILEVGPALNRPLFRWVGVTNGEGKFEARTPAGRFKVTATLPSTTNTPPGNSGVISLGAAIVPRVPTATVEVTVEAGVFTDVTLHIDTGLR